MGACGSCVEESKKEEEEEVVVEEVEMSTIGYEQVTGETEGRPGYDYVPDDSFNRIIARDSELGRRYEAWLERRSVVLAPWEGHAEPPEPGDYFHIPPTQYELFSTALVQSVVGRRTGPSFS